MTNVVVLFNFRDIHTFLENEIKKKALLPKESDLCEFIEVWLADGLEELCWIGVPRTPNTNRVQAIRKRLRQVDSFADTLLYGLVKPPVELVERAARFKFTRNSLVLFYD